jgi:MarR family transcriptional regulator, lower aerobic nicotinate degradation pathway regulator
MSEIANNSGRGEQRSERWLNSLTGPEEPEHHLPPMLLYRLLKLSNLMMRPLFMKRAEAFQMNINELRVLMTLARMGEAASHELCEVAGIHPMNVSRAVSVLRAQGRIEERRDEDNRRRKLLRLTPEGRRVSEKLQPAGRSVAERLFAGVDRGALLQLSAIIDKLTENVLAEM